MQRDTLLRDLTVRSETIDEDARTVDVVLATDNRVTVYDMERYEPIEEILQADGAELPEQVPMLDSHNRWQLDAVLGSLRNLRIQNNQVVATAYFAEGIERADKAWKMVRQGHLRAISVGYRSLKYTEIEPNASREIGGTTYTAGRVRLRVTHKWAPHEGSLVVIGADPAATVRNDHPLHGDAQMNQQLRNYLTSLGLRADATDAQAWEFFNNLQGMQRVSAELIRSGVQISNTRADGGEEETDRADDEEDTDRMDDEEDESSRADDDEDDEPAEGERGSAAVIGERQRITTIQQMASDDVDSTIVQRAISEGWSTERAARHFLDHSRGRRSAAVPNANTRRLSGDEQVRSLAASFCERMGVDPVAATRAAVTSGRRHMSEDQVNQIAERAANDASRYPIYHMLDLCRHALRLENRTCPTDREELVRAAVSTASLGSIFTTSVNAVLLETFIESPDTTTGWTHERDVTNFMTQERHALEKSGSLRKLNRGATAKHMDRAANQETYKIARYAEQFVIDEQDIIDDIMNALIESPQEMGMAAARLRPDLVYSILLGNPNMRDNTALFHADHNNTTSNAMTKANIQTAASNMRKQQENNVNLNIEPTHLVCATELDFDAREITRASQILLAGDTDRTVPNMNALVDLNIDVRSDGRLSNGVTDPDSGTAHAGSATTWFLAGARTRRTIEVGYLAGTGRRPQVRQFVLDRGQWGIGFDVKMDIGAKALSWQALSRGNS